MRYAATMLVMWMLVSAAVVVAAEPEPAKADCGCAATFGAAVREIETGYAGFSIKVDAARREAYDRFKTLLRQDAARASSERCGEVLDLYIAFFQDYHLFVLRPGKAAPVGASTVQPWTEAKARAEIERRRETLDPVEGLWRSRTQRIALLHPSGRTAGTFLAVALAANGAASTDVIAELERSPSGNYRVRFRDGSGAWQVAEGSLHRGGALLEFATEGWLRMLPASADTRFDPADPQAPVFTRLDARTLYLSLPSFDPRHAQPLKTIIANHKEEITQAHGLIIDLRGNAGGNAIYFPLVPFLISGPTTVREDGLILASPRNLDIIEGWRAAMKEQGTMYDPVLQRMRDNPGKLVRYLDPATYTPAPADIEPGPDRVVLLTDRGVGSAAEAMVMQARESSRVIVVGENTRGNIDYEEVSLGAIGCGAAAVSFGMPIYTRNSALPNGALDIVGITPDVPVPAGLADPLEFAVRLLAQ